MATVVLRPLRSGERRPIVEVFEGLSERSRRLRFLGSKPRLLERDVQWLVNVGCCGREAVVASDPETGATVGIARFVRDAGAPEAEIAFEVVDEWQGRGIGKQLVTELRSLALEQGILRFRALVAHGNQAAASLGARIAAPKGLATRPTGDRVREAAFNLIGPVDEASVLDLFAGSGAMGLEALSRGAASVTFVESDRAACRTIADNLEKLRLTGARITCGDAVWALRQETRSYDVVLVDPPYETWAELEPKLAALLPGVVAPDGLLVVETSARTDPQLPLHLRTSRRYGSARLTLFEHS